MLSRDFKNLLISEYKKVFNDFYLTIFQSKKDENIFYIAFSEVLITLIFDLLSNTIVKSD